MNIKIVGIDLAKNVFQICVLLKDNTIQRNYKVSRAKFLHSVRQFPIGTLIAMEACGTSHHWARLFQELGHKVKLIPAQHVKPFVTNQKNDANDALAICEAAFRPGIHYVPVKSIEQQDIKALRCVRTRLVQNRTATVNQIRSLAAEYGVTFPLGRVKLYGKLQDVLEDATNGFSFVLRELLNRLGDDLKFLDMSVDSIDCEIKALCKLHPRYKALLSIPGFGPIVAASFMSEVGSGEQFKNGRQVSAWCGLVPTQSSSAGKIRMGNITKNGCSELRVLLIHGARAVSRFAAKRDDTLGKWFNSLSLRRGKNKAIVALANKLARIAWHILTGKNEFIASKAFA